MFCFPENKLSPCDNRHLIIIGEGKPKIQIYVKDVFFKRL